MSASAGEEREAGVEPMSSGEAAAARRAQRKALRAAAPAPERNCRYDGLGLDQIRGLRNQLVELQIQVAYWQRVLRQRAEMVRSTCAPKPQIADHSRTLAAGAALRQRVQACDVWSTGDLADVPDLVEVWSRDIDAADASEIERLGVDLLAALECLDAWQSDLHERHRLATVELLARYRADPCLALHLLA